MYGVDSIPAHWLGQLELRQEIETIANNLAAVRDETLDMESMLTDVRYPDW